MIDDPSPQTASNVTIRFGLIEVAVLGAASACVAAQAEPAGRMRMAILMLAVCASYLALSRGLAELRSRLAKCDHPGGAAAKLGMIVAITLGTASAYVAALGELADRPGLRILLLALCVSSFALARGLARLRPKTAFVSGFINFIILLYLQLFYRDRFYVEPDMLDRAFASLAIAATALVLGRAALDISGIKVPCRDGLHSSGEDLDAARKRRRRRPKRRYAAP